MIFSFSKINWSKNPIILKKDFFFKSTKLKTPWRQELYLFIFIYLFSSPRSGRRLYSTHFFPLSTSFRKSCPTLWNPGHWVYNFPWSLIKQPTFLNKGIICSRYVHSGSERCQFLFLVFTKHLFNNHTRILPNL